MLVKQLAKLSSESDSRLLVKKARIETHWRDSQYDNMKLHTPLTLI